jgi:HKD family nuclease
MELHFLAQGLKTESKNTVGWKLIELFENPKYHTFTAFTAFTSLAGVAGIAAHINRARKHLRSATIITGIDQKGTSKEALDAFLLIDVNSYVFYTPNNAIFHPKIYLFEGDTFADLIIGSSNLTAQGLFMNVEASMHISVEVESKDYAIVQEFKSHYEHLFTLKEPNLLPLSNELITDLVAQGIVPTEEERKANHEKLTNSSTSNENKRQPFPKRSVAKIPSEFRSSKISKSNIPAQKEATFSYTKMELLWESGALTKRPLNIPSGNNTNATGSMYFTKGKWNDIDQRHYFREQVFGKLNWRNETAPGKNHLERTEAIFKLEILGESHGDFELTLTHNKRTDSKTYQQKNSSTQISWGAAKQLIAKKENLGKTAKLYRTASENCFILEIS